MTSLFEQSPPTNQIPVDLVTRDVRGVSLLEFAPLFHTLEDENEAEEAEPEFAVDERAVQLAAMIAAAREETETQLRREFDQELEDCVEQERRRTVDAIHSFGLDRQRYFAAAESQVVHLALAIARRVLCREVEMDVLHLQATVRAALARVKDESLSTLRVAPAEAPLWQNLFSMERNLKIAADERIPAGECMLETSVGRVEMGVETQLREIERGFGDLFTRQGI